MTRSSANDECLDRIGAEYLERRRRGETPTIDEYCDRHPDLSHEIRPFLKTLELVEDLPGPADTEKTTTKPEVPVSREIGDYRIVREIGRGGMGIVYEAEQKSLHRRVALKLLPDRWLQDESALIRFQHEARATARMHHSNIVPVFDVGKDGQHYFYAMQLIDGQSLDHVIKELSPDFIPAPDPSDRTGSARMRRYRWIARIGLQAAEATAYAHQRGIIHRDIKPSNLLLDEGGVVWVTDFGLAKTDDQELTQSGDYLGTLRYMSPERFRGECDERADIYALGLSLYELVAGQPAFSSVDHLSLIESIRSKNPTRLRTIDRDLPRDLETIILKATDKDPTTRYASADALAEDLRRFIAY